MTTSEQSRADAIADAETLRLVSGAAWDAGHLGYQAIGVMRSGRCGVFAPQIAGRIAYHAAKLARMMVPGLRGEQ
jgi:hypothetical protein